MIGLILCFLASIFIFIIWFKAKDRVSIAGLFQALASVVLVGVTWYYVAQVRIGSQQQSVQMNKYIEQLETNRKQSIRPYAYVFFYWREDINKFMVIVQNLGLGPAFDIKFRYKVLEKKEEHGSTIRMVATGREHVENTVFGAGDLKLTDRVQVNVSYKDIFGNEFQDQYQYSVPDMHDAPYSEHELMVHYGPKPL